MNKLYLIVLIIIFILSGCSDKNPYSDSDQPMKNSKSVFLSPKMVTMSSSRSEQSGERYLLLKLHQSRLSLNVASHLKDKMNEMTFRLPVSNKFWNDVKIGDELLDKEKQFRTGSLLMSGSIGYWKLTVIGKE